MKWKEIAHKYEHPSVTGRLYSTKANKCFLLYRLHQYFIYELKTEWSRIY